MPRFLRILILLGLLLGVMVMTLAEGYWVRTWSHPLRVAIYPIAVDAQSRAYVAGLREADFHEIGDFLLKGARRRGLQDVPDPVIELKAPLATVPPLVQPTSRFEAIRFSLGMRWFAFRNTPFWSGLGTVRLFLLYHQPVQGGALPHSLGLKKGLLGVVHVFAEDRQHDQNNVVITHELLHALGATDKYDARGMPIHPLGYADPYALPLLPQSEAEIMAGRVPISATRAEIPASLDQTVVGHGTAAEIGW